MDVNMDGLKIVNFNDNQAPFLFTQSLHECGFVLIEDAPVNDNLLQINYKLWQQFFKSPQKLQYQWDPKNEDGYISPNLSEIAKGRQIKDLKEFYHLKPHGQIPLVLEKEALELFAQLCDCGKLFLSWIEASLPASIKAKLSEPLKDMIKGSNNTVLRSIHYPPLTGREPAGAVRAAAHEDINLLTVLPAASAEGLEVQDHSGKWHRLKLQPNQLVVNTGDMLKECTGGYIKSTSHRVVNPSMSDNKSRLSMPLFLHPRCEVVLSDRYTAGAYRLERISENGVQNKTNTMLAEEKA